MEAMRQSWTDDRLDDLRDTVHEFRAETKVEFAAVRSEMRDGFAEQRTDSKAGFDAINERFDRMQQTLIASLIAFSGLVTAALIGLVATQL
jgi:hypothetical protein